MKTYFKQAVEVLLQMPQNNENFPFSELALV